MFAKEPFSVIISGTVFIFYPHFSAMVFAMPGAVLLLAFARKALHTSCDSSQAISTFIVFFLPSILLCRNRYADPLRCVVPVGVDALRFQLTLVLGVLRAAVVTDWVPVWAVFTCRDGHVRLPPC